MNAVQVNTAELREFRKELRRMEKALSRKEINDIQRRHARPILADMKRNSPSKDLPKVMGITTRQVKRPKAPRIGIRIGVINNKASLFPKFSAPALASVLEYGTAERFRKLSRAGFITGHQSTGKVKARPSLRPAWDRNVRPFMNNVERAYIKKVER